MGNNLLFIALFSLSLVGFIKLFVREAVLLQTISIRVYLGVYNKKSQKINETPCIFFNKKNINPLLVLYIKETMVCRIKKIINTWNGLEMRYSWSSCDNFSNSFVLTVILWCFVLCDILYTCDWFRNKRSISVILYKTKNIIIWPKYHQ